MSYESWISHRYLTSKKSHFLSFLNIVSVSGVAIGVSSLIVVLGVMEGFGNNLREKIVGTTPHVMVERETGIKDYQNVIGSLESIDGVKGASPYVQGNVFIEASSQAMGLIIRGIDVEGERLVTQVDKYLIGGSLHELKGDSVVIGKELARYFGFSVGDEITVISPGAGIEGQKWRYKLKIVAIFSTGMVDFDTNLILTDIPKAQEIFGLPPELVSGIGVRVADEYKADIYKQEIYEKIGFSYAVKTWIDINRNLFEALFLEKWGLFIVLTLMVIVASFNIISTLIVTVTSKVHDIGILQSLGATSGSIRRIFIQQGVSIGLLGIFWGVLVGVGLSYSLKTYIKVPPQIYSIEHVPVELNFFDILIIICSAMLISFLATIYPAGRAAKLQPVEALRYE